MRAPGLALALAALACSCGADSEPGPAPGPDAAEAEHGHVHAAPHGGLLVALGPEEAHVELLLDPAEGELTAWLLDAEAEAPLKSAQPALVVRLGAAEIRLEPVGSALTGETAGDTSQFRARSPALVGATLGGTIERVEVLGRTYADVAIEPEAR